MFIQIDYSINLFSTLKLLFNIHYLIGRAQQDRNRHSNARD
jgi:hypothetical protein